MVCPYRHLADYTETTDEEAAEIADLTRQAMRVVRSVSGAGGFNIGMNQGAVAGAGIADHLHQHAVPRWGGDTNFMPVVGLTRVLPQVLRETRALLAEAWQRLDVAQPDGQACCSASTRGPPSPRWWPRSCPPWSAPGSHRTW